jgi:oxygen-independent coproporphyrinogen-3 oxidase
MHDARVRLVIFDRARIVHGVHDRRSRSRLRRLRQAGGNGAKQNEGYVPEFCHLEQRSSDSMSNTTNHNSDAVVAVVRVAGPSANAGDTPAATVASIYHLYVHIPFCARICPYCAFYKDLLDRSQTWRFCEAILRDLDQQCASFALAPETIYFGGGTPTALTTSQLEFLLGGFRERLDLSSLAEWTIEANPGSVSARKAALLRKLGVTRVSLGVQSWDDELLKLLGREHNSQQAEQSFHILRAAGFSNINVDLMFGLPGQTIEQWKFTLEKTVALQPDHISAYCLTYEEDTEFLLRHARGELLQDTDADAAFFEMAMSILEEAGYEQYEISNYARSGFSSVHNRAYWLGKDYLGIGPSAFSTVGMNRWQNICDYRAYIDRVLSGEAPIGFSENLTDEMKRTERIALSLRTRDGIAASELEYFVQQTDEFISLGLLQESNDNFVLTRKGKELADSVADAFL